MKAIKISTVFLISFVTVLFVGAPFSSCKKETTTVHDTTTVTVHVHDTTIKNVHDTVIVNDTVYDFGAGLVAYYNFNGGSLKDSSGNNNNIAFNNATAAEDRFGNAGNAYAFDGSSSYMQVPNNPNLNPGTITMFAIVKVNGFYQGNCHINVIIMKGNKDEINGLYTLRFTDNSACSIAPDVTNEKFSGIFGDDVPQGSSASTSSGTTKIETGKWYYLAYTYDGITSNFYINGQLVESNKKTVAFTANTYDLFLGKTENTSYPYYFNGVIDEVRLYSRALTAKEILLLTTLMEKK